MQKLLAKIKIFEQAKDRTYMGYLTPVDAILASATGARLTKHELDWALECKTVGKAFSRWYYFKVKSKSILAEKLDRKFPR